jgi:hypothetical protein
VIDVYRKLWGSARWIVIPLLAGAILIGLFLATGGGGQSSSSSAPAPTPTTAPTTLPPAPTGQIQALMSVRIRHVTAHTWSFNYRIQNTGRLPVAGFELNGPQANLFHIQGRASWAFYGSGVCKQQHPGVLIYWSVGAASLRTIPPKHIAHFKFTVNTTGTAPLRYSVSWGSATPLFGVIAGPAPSSMPTTGPCTQ